MSEMTPGNNGRWKVLSFSSLSQIAKRQMRRFPCLGWVAAPHSCAPHLGMRLYNSEYTATEPGTTTTFSFKVAYLTWLTSYRWPKGFMLLIVSLVFRRQHLQREEMDQLRHLREARTNAPGSANLHGSSSNQGDVLSYKSTFASSLQGH